MRRLLAVAAVGAALMALAGCGATPSPASETVKVKHGDVFAAAGGEVLCELGVDGAGATATCAVPQDLHPPRKVQTACAPLAMNHIALSTAGGTVGYGCGTDVPVVPTGGDTRWAVGRDLRQVTVGPRAVPVLPAGLSLRAGALECTAAHRGVHCADGDRWFTLTAASLHTSS